MKYPAIYKSVEGSEYLYQNKDSYYCYERQVWDLSEPHHDCHHSDKNITAEYLANTCGEVKSKGHAEFIVKLAETNEMPCSCNVVSGDCKYFYFINKKLFFASKEMDLECDYKKITIPLPPECESVDEWPRVGEVVLTASKSKAKVLATHNKKVWVEYVSGAHGFNTLNIASLQKPKTPEQELRDEISDLAFNQFNDDSYDLTHNSYYLAEQLISKYNITKKGEGDE